MTLEGYKLVSESATRPGAAIDASQVNSFRQNDVLFEQLIQALMCSPFMPSTAAAGLGSGDVVVNGSDFAKQFINAKTISVTAKCTLTARVPLIWIAHERITISAEIDAVGKGAQAGEVGDFGGSGGGAATAGADCVMPFMPINLADTEPVKDSKRILRGGTAGNLGLNLENADAWRLSRAILHLPWLIGGASGADSGGAGGGIVCLCAPVIEIKGIGKINVAGENATVNNRGGGGGGFVYLVGRQLINAVLDTTILIGGGTAAGGSGRAGGRGMFVRHEFK